MTTSDQLVPAPRPKRHPTRRALAATLVVIGGIMAPVAVGGLWARSLINSDNAYVNAVAPLATDPTVTAALEDRVTDAVMNAVDGLDISGQVQTYLSGLGLPDRLATLAGSAVAGLSDNLRNLVSNTVSTVIEAPQFATAWANLNRAVHHAFVAVIDGDSSLLDAEGNIALQLQPVITAVEQKLVADGHSWAKLLPNNITAEWVLVPADQVNSIRDTVNLLRTVAIVLVIVELVVIAGAVLLAPDRLRGGAWMGFGLAAGSLAVLGALRYAEHTLISNYPQLQHPDAALTVLQTVTSALVNWLRLLFLVGIVAAVVLALLGRGERARRARSFLSEFRVKMSNPPYSGPRRVGAGVIALACAVTLLFVDDLSGTAVASLLFLLLLSAVLAIIPGARLPIPETVVGVTTEGLAVPAVLVATPITPLTEPLPTADRAQPDQSKPGPA